ncbi:DNA mismatch repair protein MutL [bioreactor metagenome]|uniref:DNA mismatch repair protein MutL n=1 Tax=bioreactor metagenome TaxID=1076179 RepID=A0A644X449_9ZZZZ
MLCPVQFDDGYLKIEGFVGTPELARANRSGQTITLNGRIIRSNALSNALSRAFDTRVMGGKFPFAVLALSLSFQEVDVNVHPAKLEVRFADEQRIARSIVVSCSEAVTRSYIPSFAVPEDITPETTEHARYERLEQTPYTPALEHAPQIDLRAPAPQQDVTLRENSSGFQPPPRVPLYRFPKEEQPAVRPTQHSIFLKHEESDAPEEPYTVIGCAFDAYWFVQQGDSVYLIDQHAAHERLLYDAMMNRVAAVVSQTLFLPEDVRLLPSETEQFSEHRKELEAFGFVFSDVTETSVTLLAVPQVKGTPLKGTFLHDVLEHLSGEKAVHQNEWFRDAIAQAACKSAVKAGERLSREELHKLIDSFRAGDALLTCPHGRPVAVRLTKLEIEKLFKRVL